jgi:Tol biopolymer transport system component
MFQMPLETGSRVGPYEISGLLGKGGMGEVYRARDTRLDRTVAIKTLSGELSIQPQFRERFVREAKAISSLNHAHICTLYDVGQHDQISYLVMEYIAGETLSQRLKKGPVLLSEALDWAAQVADALDHAHRRGVVHRDLKPANIVLTKAGAKLLDFGIAKLVAPLSDSIARPLDPIAHTMTTQGMVVGTLHYMAPEQLHGQEVDGRADLFALGCVIYEMVIGARAFDGGSQATIITKIVSGEPERIADLAALGPPELERLVRRCLAKDPDDRWQTARDLRAELKWIHERLTQPRTVAAAHTSAALTTVATPPVQPTGTRRFLVPRLAPWILAAAALAVAAAVVGWGVGRGRPAFSQDGPVVRFTLNSPADSPLVIEDVIGGSAISPDGSRIAFVAMHSGKPVLALRSLDSIEVKSIDGSQGAAYPFWAPDSRWIGFFAEEKLKKVPVAGGRPQVICDAPEPHGGTWSDDGTIVFSPHDAGPLYRVRDTGGTSSPLTQLNPAEKEIGHHWPQLLPGNQTILFLARTSQRQANQVYAATLASPQTPAKLIFSNYGAAYATNPATMQGWLLYLRDETLLAQPFDPIRLSLSGEPAPVAFGVGSSIESGYAGFSTAANGVLVFRSGGDKGRRLRFFGRDGRVVGEAGEPDWYTAVAWSPDASRVVVTRVDADTGLVDLWLIEPARQLRSRLTFDDGIDTSPVWSPDGAQIVFSSSAAGTLDLHLQKLDGSSRPTPLYKNGNPLRPTDWSRDGAWIVYEEDHPESKRDLWMLRAAGQGSPKLLLRTPFNEYQGQLSPDGKRLAYTSDDSGRPEVFVRDLDLGHTPYRVSTNGGSQPRWRDDGGELYYDSADGKLMAVLVSSNAVQFSAAAPVPLFSLPSPTAGVADFRYDAAPKGEKFVAIVPDGADKQDLSVLVNWHRMLQ